MMRLEFQTERRGYLLLLERDLIGDFVLYRRWYGLNNRRWGQKRQVFLSEAEAWREVKRIQKTRQRHGYCLAAVEETGMDCPDPDPESAVAQ
jgi:hypothetical protein